jgi:hypothetical protein
MRWAHKLCAPDHLSCCTYLCGHALASPAHLVLCIDAAAADLALPAASEAVCSVLKLEVNSCSARTAAGAASKLGRQGLLYSSPCTGNLCVLWPTAAAAAAPMHQSALFEGFNLGMPHCSVRGTRIRTLSELEA